MTDNYVDRFVESARRVGAEVIPMASLNDAVIYISKKISGTALVPETALEKRYQLRSLLREAGVDVFKGNFRDAGRIPGGGITFSNFSLADSGTVVLESTAEDIRLATTLPEIHCVIVDPATILEDNLAAVKPMTELHQGSEARFVAYITGPSRTADIERVLTIGCHGPRELHILLVENISSDLMEN
jgi:L-lactate dehydrogenase complex protein LldG